MGKFLIIKSIFSIIGVEFLSMKEIRLSFLRKGLDVIFFSFHLVRSYRKVNSCLSRQY